MMVFSASSLIRIKPVITKIVEKLISAGVRDHSVHVFACTGDDNL